MRPDYSCDKNDKKTLMAYRKLIDSLEPEGSTEFNYEPMDLVTTSKYKINFFVIFSLLIFEIIEKIIFDILLNQCRSYCKSKN